MAGMIFINYRRVLNLKDAQLLEKILQKKFGAAKVFLDTSGLEGGKHWLHTLEAQVDASSAMVSLIGKGWADVPGEAGARRLDNPDDFVRFEIARAFSRKIPVLPVLIDGAAMPDTPELPRNLLPLLFVQAMLFRAESANDDGEKIANRLAALIEEAKPKGARVWMAGAAAVALAAGIAAGPSLQTALGILPPIPADATAAMKARQEAEADARQARKDAEAASRERNRAQAALKTAQEALASAQAKGEAAASYTAELAAQLKTAEQKLSEAQTALTAANERAEREEAARKKAEAGPTPRPRDTREDTARATAGLMPGESFKDCTNCPEMVVVPAGSFTMGSPEEEPQRNSHESPQRRVTFEKPFSVGRFAVTFTEWDACVDAGGCGGYRPSDEGWGRGDRPVINLSWNDAEAYVRWLSKKTGKEYRLLSEAEREYVTRAGTTTPFWWGSSISTRQANYNGNYTYNGSQTGEYRGMTLPVKSFEPNPWGLYQVHGNVSEWVEDCYSDYHNAPSDGSAWKTGNCPYRMLRGGSWGSGPQYLRAAYRDISVAPDKRIGNFGFRVAAGWQDLNR
jgi:formylglycine-generating enzyme required for sulfatase activity